MSLARKMSGTFLEGDDAAMMCISPDWLDADIEREWNRQRAYDAVPAETTFERDVLHKYSARQMREYQPEHDTYWAEDGELQSFVVAATPKRDYPQTSTDGTAS